MGKPSTPKAPDYAAAAKEQGAANLNSAIATNYLNQANQVTPQGTLTYSYDTTKGNTLPDGTIIPQTTVTTTLSPEQQQLYDQNTQLSIDLNNLAGRGLDFVSQATANPLTSSQFGPRGTAPTLGDLISYQRSPVLQQFGYGQGVPQFDINKVNPTSLGDFSYNQPIPGLDNISGFTGSLPNYSEILNNSGTINSSINPNARTSSGPLQFDYGYSGLAPAPSVDQFSSDRDYITNLTMQRLQPFMDQEQAALDTRLANQGITLGGEAYSDAQLVQGRRANDQRIAALLAGSQEQQRLFQNALALRQQGVGELTAQGNYYNAARGQEFGQNLAGSEADFAQRLSALGFGNQAQAQRFGQGMTAAGQGLQDALAVAGFNAGAVGQNNAQRLAAQQQGYNQALGAAGFNKDNALQRFQMGMASQQDLLAQQQQALAAQQQGFNQALTTTGTNNATAQAQFAQDQSANAFANQSALQQFQSGLASTQLAEDIRSRAIQEANFMQMQPLNILNALRTGNQVTMPQFGNWTAGGQVAAAPVYQAAQDQYNAAMQAYQAKMQSYGGLMGGLASLGGAALLGPLGAGGVK